MNDVMVIMPFLPIDKSKVVVPLRSPHNIFVDSSAVRNSCCGRGDFFRLNRGCLLLASYELLTSSVQLFPTCFGRASKGFIIHSTTMVRTHAAAAAAVLVLWSTAMMGVVDAKIGSALQERIKEAVAKRNKKGGGGKNNKKGNTNSVISDLVKQGMSGKVGKGMSRGIMSSYSASPSPSPRPSPSPSPRPSSRSATTKKKIKGGKAGNGKNGKTHIPDISPAPTKMPKTPKIPVKAPAPVAVKTDAPVVPDTPVAAPVAAPVTSAPTRCTPTVGTCRADEASLADILQTAAPGSTIAMCGDSTITTTSGPFNIANDDITFCCATTGCVLKSGVPDRILQVTGRSVTLQDLTFQNGRAMDDDGGTGGNVQIDAAGNHRIIDSAFLNGEAAGSGGNVYIQTIDGTVTIEGSIFNDGTASFHGGGLHVIGATDVMVTGTLFERNAAMSGGGLSTTRGSEDATGQAVTIEDSMFNMNSAMLGGGFLVSTLGQLPSLSILNTEFIANNAVQLGGVGVVAEFFEDIALEFSGNSGDRNTADTPICAEIFTIIEEDTEPLCLEVNADFP